MERPPRKGAFMQRVRRLGAKAEAARSPRVEEKAGSNRKVALRKGDIDGRQPSRTADWRVKRQSRIRKEPTMEVSPSSGWTHTRSGSALPCYFPGGRPLSS